MGSDEQFSAGDVLIGVNTLMPWGFLLNLKLAKVKSFADDFRAFPPLIEAIVLHEALVVPSIEHAITFLSLSGNTSDDITLILKEFPDVEDDPAYNVYSSRINEYIQFLKAHLPSYRSKNRVNQVMMNMIKNDLLLTSSAHTRGLAVRLAYGEVIAYYLELVRDMNTRNNVYHGALDNILEEITGSVNDKLADLNSILPGNRFTLDVPL